MGELLLDVLWAMATAPPWLGWLFVMGGSSALAFLAGGHRRCWGCS